MTLIIGQVKDFLGLAFPAGAPAVETMDELQAVAQSIGTANWQAFVVGAICLAILFPDLRSANASPDPLSRSAWESPWSAAMACR